MLETCLNLFHILLALPTLSASLTQTAQGQTSPKLFSQKGNVELVLVPAGEFTMGGTMDRAKPQRKVTLDAYLIGKTLVSNGQFKAYCKANGIPLNRFDGLAKSNDNMPVVEVTWQDARDFCRWAGGDLPTEAQWEKAARGTDGREYPWGNAWDGTRVQWSAEKVGSTSGTGAVTAHPTGASPYGCLDMAGNVRQWCLDYYVGNYSGLPNQNPVRTTETFTTSSSSQRGNYQDPLRVLRGSSFLDHDPNEFKTSSRHAIGASFSFYYFGFRMASKP